MSFAIYGKPTGTLDPRLHGSVPCGLAPGELYDLVALLKQIKLLIDLLVPSTTILRFDISIIITRFHKSYLMIIPKKTVTLRFFSGLSFGPY